jgi:glycerol-3-phosphate acyltransferase PlsY
MVASIIIIILAYLLGSVSGSLLLGRIKKVDIRKHGSGNAGGTNALRTQGLAFALGVVVIDIGKGFMAAWWVPTLNIGGSPQLLDTNMLTIACSFAAVLGHCYPAWHGFRGGKGAATATGALIALQPWLLLPVVAIWLVTLMLTGYVGLATVLAGFSLIPAALWMNNPGLLIFSSVIAFFLLFTHRGNIRRLRDGTEHRFRRLHLFPRKQ